MIDPWCAPATMHQRVRRELHHLRAWLESATLRARDEWIFVMRSRYHATYREIGLALDMNPQKVRRTMLWIYSMRLRKRSALISDITKTRGSSTPIDLKRL